MRADATPAARVREAAGAHLRAAADTVLEFPWGWGVSTPSLPGWLDLNFIAVERAEPVLDRLQATVRAALPGATWLSVEAWPPASADLLPASWERHRFVLLAHTDPARVPPSSVTSEVAREAVAELRREWLLAEGVAPELLGQAAVAETRVFTQTPTRAFAVCVEGRAVACAQLVAAGPVRMIEDVYTTPARRGHGLGGAVVRAAAAAAHASGAELVWLATAADGRARPLYERLGFSPVLTVAQARTRAA